MSHDRILSPSHLAAPSRLRRISRAATAEHTALITLVGLAGLGAFGALGVSAHDAIAGSTGGTVDLARRGASMPLHTAAVSGDAAASALAKAARGLYRNVPVQVPRSLRNARTALKAPNLFGLLDTEKLSANEFVSRVQATYPQLDEAGLRLSYDLLTEFKRLRDTGAIDGSVSWANNTLKQTADDVAWALTWLQDAEYGPASSGYVLQQVTKARDRLTAAGKPVPEEFFARIMLAAEIFENGTTPERIREVFGAARRGAPGGDLARFLGRYEGASPGPFAIRYAGDPAAALAALPERTRKYLEAELLPILRSKVPDEGGTDVRLFTRDQEAEVVARIVGGDVDGARAAADESDVLASAERGPDVLDAIEYAAAMFQPYEESLGPLRRFKEEEAERLVRIDGDLDALRAREEGGAAVADFVEALREADYELRAGRAPEHRDRVVDGVLRAAARGLPGDLDDVATYLEDIFVDFPERVLADLRRLADRFADAE